VRRKVSDGGRGVRSGESLSNDDERETKRERLTDTRHRTNRPIQDPTHAILERVSTTTLRSVSTASDSTDEQKRQHEDTKISESGKRVSSTFRSNRMLTLEPRSQNPSLRRSIDTTPPSCWIHPRSRNR